MIVVYHASQRTWQKQYLAVRIGACQDNVLEIADAPAATADTTVLFAENAVEVIALSHGFDQATGFAVPDFDAARVFYRIRQGKAARATGDQVFPVLGKVN